MAVLIAVQDEFNFKRQKRILRKVIDLYIPNNTQVNIQAKLPKFNEDIKL